MPERFVGLHFDFHAKATDIGIGRSLTEQYVDSFLKITKPDYIQVDCKGHPGYSSYPTKVGNVTPQIAKDILQIYRKVTTEDNVGLYAHYSGLIDMNAAQKHPEWAVVKPDGTKDSSTISPSSGYVDGLMIPQLKELATTYKLDGAWIDGDCWAARLDYSNSFTNAFKNKYGVANIPKNAADINYVKWIEFNRDAYKKYLNHIVDEMHKVNPRFQIADNWAFGSIMPEKIDANVDFLSEDIRGETPYQSAFESRMLADQGKPWDIMSWAPIERKGKTVYKSQDQLDQEAANALALGGGFQSYWQQSRDGSLLNEYFNEMAAIIDFCRQRKNYCFKGQIVPQIGVLYSYNTWKSSVANDRYYSNYGAGVVNAVVSTLINKQYSVSILRDFKVKEDASQYPLIIMPQWGDLGDDVIQQLKEYVRNGGNLLVLGAGASRTFADIGKIELIDNPQKQVGISLQNKDSANISVTADFQKTKAPAGTETITAKNATGPFAQYPLASISQFGKGKIGLVYINVLNIYSQGGQAVDGVENLIVTAVRKLFASPISTVKDAPQVEQVVSQKDNHLFIHLINMGGKENAYDKIPPVSSFNVEVSLDKKPSVVIMQPEHKSLPFTYANGKLEINVPGLDIYSILQID
jgi:hypothetical protein